MEDRCISSMSRRSGCLVVASIFEPVHFKKVLALSNVMSMQAAEQTVFSEDESSLTVPSFWTLHIGFVVRASLPSKASVDQNVTKSLSDSSSTRAVLISFGEYSSLCLVQQVLFCGRSDKSRVLHARFDLFPFRADRCVICITGIEEQNRPGKSVAGGDIISIVPFPARDTHFFNHSLDKSDLGANMSSEGIISCGDLVLHQGKAVALHNSSLCKKRCYQMGLSGVKEEKMTLRLTEMYACDWLD